MKETLALKKEDFRKWLTKNHQKETKVSVILYKRHTGKPAPSHRELMEEAICFGWIDTVVRRLDENRYIRTFSKRNKNSKWSNNTIGYAEELIKQKRMTPMGLKFYKEGKSKPTHDHNIPKNPEMPLELKKEFSKNKTAKENFNNFPPSLKKMYYRWILSGKLEKTRIKRIKLIIEAAKKGKRDIFKTQEKVNT